MPMNDIENYTEKDWKECLEHFGNCDAFTGQPLINPVRHLIIPVEFNGDYIKENIIPCNEDIDLQRGDNHFIHWYKDQPFYDAERLYKILEWMGDYKKFLFVPAEQGAILKGVKGSLKVFSITLPIGVKTKLFYAPTMDKSIHVKLIEKVVLSRWKGYLDTRWLWAKKYDPFKFNHEDKVKALLDRCGTFILIGEFRQGMLLTEEKKSAIYSKEIPLSCTGDNVQDIVFGTDTDAEDYTVTALGDGIQAVDVENVDNDKTIGAWDKKKVKETYKRKKAKHLKINALYSTPTVYRTTVYKMTNQDNLDSTHIYAPEFPEGCSLSEIITKEDKEWKRKPFTNAHKENVYGVKQQAYGGNIGIIDYNAPYKYQWCLVDTEGVFEFEDRKYKIDNTVNQYAPRLVKNRKGELIDIIYDMDKILVYAACEAGNEEINLSSEIIHKPILKEKELYFFDMNIDKIDSNFITEIR
jgi:hypothetical protein